MKMTKSLLAILNGFVIASSFAGPPEFRQEVAPPPACGTGWYFGLDGGVNVYQDFGDARSFDVGGTEVRIDTNDHIGGFGGIKFGYVFGSGTWRFGLEEDWYYNGVDATATAAVNGREVASANGLFNTAAFMTNLMLRYAPNGGCGFQPYILGGLGGWWGETGGDIDVTVNGVTRHSSSKDNGGFAFQLGVGADYYFSPKWSVFTEYKFLDYTNAGGEFTNSNVGQHLIGAGMRIHF
jgi:opacity protein-like surface antigen